MKCSRYESVKRIWLSCIWYYSQIPQGQWFYCASTWNHQSMAAFTHCCWTKRKSKGAVSVKYKIGIAAIEQYHSDDYQNTIKSDSAYERDDGQWTTRNVQTYIWCALCRIFVVFGTNRFPSIYLNNTLMTTGQSYLTITLMLMLKLWGIWVNMSRKLPGARDITVTKARYVQHNTIYTQKHESRYIIRLWVGLSLIAKCSDWVLSCDNNSVFTHRS